MTDRPTAVMTDPWGARARDWAEIEDEGSRPLFEEVLDLTKVGSGSRYLDIGCGSGLACQIAHGRRATVGGIDSSPGLIAVAQERTPDGDFRVGDMGSLPWDDDSFDAVTFINTFFFAADQDATLKEAARVTTPGGRVALIAWTSPEKCESMAYLQALGPLLPPMPMDVDPFIPPERLRDLAAGAGLNPLEVVQIDWTWDYHSDLETALRGLMSPGLSAVAIAAAGEDAVKQALVEALEPYKMPDGGYRLHNELHCLVASS